MDPLFLRVYLKLLFSLLVTAALFTVFVVPRADKQLRKNVASALSPSVRMMAQSLASARAEGRPVEPLLRQGSRDFEVNLELVPRASVQLAPEEMATLASGAPVVVGRTRMFTLYKRMEGADEVLRVGPLLNNHPLGGLRGLLVVVFLVAGMFFGAYLLLLPIKRRLGELASAADRFRGGDLSARARVESDDSLGVVARSFNRMAGDIQRLLAAQNELLRTVSHELRTPIQRIHFSIDEAVSSDDSEARAQVAQRMTRDLDELDGLIDELLTYARLRDADHLPRVGVDMNALASDLGNTLSVLARDVSFETRVEGGPFLVHADPKLLRRAISNLIVNAIRHARTRAELSLRWASGLVEVRVDDDGAGVPEAEREQIFEPFRTSEQHTLRGGRGFGLGLAIVRRVAQRFDGSVDVRDSELGGASFRLVLPGSTAQGS